MGASGRAGGARKDLEYYRAVPYVLVMESVERPGGEWVRRAEYPELPNCVAEAHSAVEAIDKLDAERLRVLQELWDRDAPIPVPRPPLQSYWQRPEEKRLAFARWLVEEGRLSDR